MRKRLLTSLTGLLLVALAVTPASANLLSIQFSGLNLYYDGNNLQTVGGEDPLATMNFFNDGALVGTLTQDIGASMFVANLGTINQGDGTYFGDGSGFGLTLSMNAGANGIILNWDSPIQVNVNQNAGVTDVSVLGSASTSDIIAQALPFGFDIQAPVQVSFSTQITDFGLIDFNETERASTIGGEYAWFDAFGTGEVSGQASPIPEPMTLLTLGLGLAGFGAARRKRK
ncbi:MAG: PEP-CTERM sorting domain-containing protein [Candidatus Eisenbacteria bacterium]|uniref:PEP-CTERM sorting domain-containing protein n=1 Tax=Eiseniibacteriota bacterium TaxID=2212470 RepID=A0A7Y2H3L2_UNCEI|nr:PEP-CTERM sorting domain-containing protein [Candidatus Eisenbacteria bacterium]